MPIEYYLLIAGVILMSVELAVPGFGIFGIGGLICLTGGGYFLLGGGFPALTVLLGFYLVAALVLAFFLSKPIRAYQLGEVYAQNMGVHLRAFRTALILLSSVLSACVTAFAGPISFVGIAVPHLMKSLFGTAEPLILIPASFLGGGAFCLLCDLIARTAFAPTEVSISSVTAVFGAPIVIYMMIHRKAG